MLDFASKCRFEIEEVHFLGHKINATGVHPTGEKLKATRKMSEPKCRAKLQSFLGLLALYDGFIQNRGSIAKVLYTLLEKDAPWQRGPHHQEFLKLKHANAERTALAHYDDSKPLISKCDGSPYGIGAVLTHLDEQGNEAPIAFISGTLGKSEIN